MHLAWMQMGDVAFVQWIDSHGILCLILYMVYVSAVTALPAPGAQSSAFYNWFFRFVTLLTMNIKRAYSTRIEQSPNWQDAVDNHVKKLNGSLTNGGTNGGAH